MSTPRRPSVPAPGSRTRPGARSRPGSRSAAGATPTAPTPAQARPAAPPAKPATKTPPKTSPTAAVRRPASRGVVGPRLRGLLPETVTTRTLVLTAVGLMVLVILLPTAREYAKQSAQLDALHAELASVEQQRADQQADLERWSDPAYVTAQARARLGYVMRGEHAYRVTGVTDADDGVSPLTGRVVRPGVVPVSPGDDSPWYAKTWTSVQVAGVGATPAG